MVLDDLKKFSPVELANCGVLVPALRQGYICPKCGSGQRENGTGLSVKAYSWGNHFQCFSCGAKFTAVDLVGEYLKVDATSREGRIEIVKWCEGKTNSPSFNRKTQETKSVTTSKFEPTNKTATAEPAKTYRKFYYFAQQELEKYLAEHGNKIRGLTAETLRRAGAGIATHTGSNKSWLVLPYADTKYFKRELDGKGKYFTAGQARSLYNPCNAFDASQEMVFVVEGEINCLSMIQAGYNAVAVGGSANFEKLAEWLNELNLQHRPILYLLPDDDKTLIEVYEKTFNALDSAGYKFCFYCFDEKGNIGDVNDVLKVYGEGTLRTLIKKIDKNWLKNF